MRVGIKIPHQGLTTREVIITEFLFEQGDAVTEGQPIMTIESEKSILEIEAPVSGTIGEILKNAGDECGIGEIVMYIVT